MSVIKEEYISSSVTRHDLLPMSFLKKSAYTGSKGKLRYRMAKTETGGEGEKENGVEEEKKTVLRVWTWATPFAFDKTPKEEKTTADFPFSEEGLSEVVSYLNRCLAQTG